ncbi:MAG: PadR family transcriptional regulator [Longimicrobiales bacterium]|nr:PadR family transcriptional regulator [Longimicrobiales bacterium]
MRRMLEDDRGLLQGTLELLILKALSWNETHGYGIARWIEAATDDALRVEEGSLYPALHRMRAKGWLESEWGTSENNRRARFYRLTDQGRAQLVEKTRGWDRTVKVVGMALSAPADPRGEPS